MSLSMPSNHFHTRITLNSQANLSSSKTECTLAQNQTYLFESCFGLTDKKEEKIFINKNSYFFRFNNFVKSFAYEVQNDINKIFMRNTSRNSFTGLIKNGEKVKFFFKNLETDFGSNNNEILSFISGYLGEIKEICSKNDFYKNKDDLREIKTKTLHFFNKLSEKLNPEEQVKFREYQADLAILSDKIINLMTSSSKNTIQECFKIAEKMWDLIASKNNINNHLKQTGAQLFFVLGSFISYSKRTNKEKFCIYVRRVAVPFIFVLHELVSYLLTKVAFNPFIAATGVSATGGAYIFGAIAFIACFLLIHTLAHKFDDFEKNSERNFEKNRLSKLRNLLQQINCENVAEFITDPTNEQKSLRKKIKDIYSTIAHEEISEKSSLDLKKLVDEFNHSHNLKNEEIKNNSYLFFISFLPRILHPDSTQDKDIANLIDLAHNSINKSDYQTLTENKLSFVSKKIAKRIIEKSGYTNSDKNITEKIEFYLTENLIYFARSIAQNKMPFKYRFLKVCLQLLAFETTDFTLDNVAVQGTLSIENTLKMNDIAREVVVNLANTGLQLAFLAPLYLIFKFPQIYLQKKFSLWEQKHVHCHNSLASNLIGLNLIKHDNS